MVKARTKRKSKAKLWSQHLTETSNSLDLEKGVFAQDDLSRIARSLMRSAERSQRRKRSPYRSAMSMLTFYINRAGRKLPKKHRTRLEAEKDELRALYGKEQHMHFAVLASVDLMCCLLVYEPTRRAKQILQLPVDYECGYFQEF